MRLAIATRSWCDLRSATAASVLQLLRSNRPAIQSVPSKRTMPQITPVSATPNTSAMLELAKEAKLPAYDDCSANCTEVKTASHGADAAGRGPRRHPAEQQESRRECGDQHLKRRDPRQHAERVDSM